LVIGYRYVGDRLSVVGDGLSVVGDRLSVVGDRLSVVGDKKVACLVDGGQTHTANIRSS